MRYQCFGDFWAVVQHAFPGVCGPGSSPAAARQSILRAWPRCQLVIWTTMSRIAVFSVLVAFGQALAWATVIALRWAIVNFIHSGCPYAGILRRVNDPTHAGI